jgi:hypothetical protein
MWGGNDEKARVSEAGSGKSGFGFGRQGEKVAGMKGTLNFIKLSLLILKLDLQDT